MRFITALILLFMLQVSSAGLPERHHVNPDDNGINYGRSAPKTPLLPFGVSSISADERFIAYFTEHENLEDSATVDYIAHKYDRILKSTLSSSRIIKNLDQGAYQGAQMVFEDASARSIIFTHHKPDSSSSSGTTDFSGFSISRYDFDSQAISDYKTDVGLGWSISPSGQYFLYVSLGALFVFDNASDIELPVPTSHILANGDLIHFLKPGILFTHHGINDQGDIILVSDSNYKNVDGASRYYKYNIKTGGFTSLKSLVSLEYNFDINREEILEFNIPLISNNGQYISFVAKNSLGELVILLLDTISLHTIEHSLPFELGEDGFLRPRLLTNTGIAQYIAILEDSSKSEEAELVYYLYDFKSNRVLENIIIPVDAVDTGDFEWKMVDQISLDSNFLVVYDGQMKNTSDQENFIEFESNLILEYLTENIENEIKIIPEYTIIDPYSNQASQFSVEVSGTDIYGIDVNCNLSSASLSVTQANYDGLFNSQTTMTLPLIYGATSLTGTETLVAPELPFTGSGSFVLADVIAEFTTEDVQVTCAAELSDENGQLLQVTLIPATIRIDDGVHGGVGSVSGSIEMPEVTDLSGVEVVLTIGGRQVTVITDETGRFEFDGLRDGEFTISLASENYVQSCQTANVAEGSAVNLGLIELLAGDINADGRIDIADFTFMAARYRSNEGEADYEVKADLNKDGTINIQDLAILGSHFGSTQCNALQ